MSKDRVYCDSDFAMLSTKLSPEEMVCVEHCGVHDDCAADGDCVLQDRAADIIAAKQIREDEVTNESKQQ